MKSFFFAAVAAGLLALAPGLALAKTVEYSLTLQRQSGVLDGDTPPKITINGTLPGPVLTFAEGDDAVIHVTNAMADPSSVHWHGLHVPRDMDGAPGFNDFKAIAPGETFTYRFPLRQSGTYWYHAHSLGQEQDGLYGAMVITPRQPEAAAGPDYVVLLSEYTPEDAADILAHLKMSSDYYQYQRRTLGDFIADLGTKGAAKTWDDFKSWGQMRMLPTDLSDVSGYDFLLNGRNSRQNWTGMFQPGQTVKLRFINAATMTIFDVRIPGLKMTVVAADGQAVKPVTIDEFRIGNAETYDVLVQPQDDKAYTIAAESMDRQGFALGTLAPRPGMKGDIPQARPRAQLTANDMNMDQMMADHPDMDMSEPAGWPQSNAPAGTRILSYADLAAANKQPDSRPPTRTITVHLDGNMERYIWTLNGQPFDPMLGINLALNERVRLVYVNDTMMAHPIHLHGMFMQLENGQSPSRLPSKHTVMVAPGQTATVVLTADQAGEWPLHCHLLYHMAAGMMTTVRVADPQVHGAPQPPMDTGTPGSGDHGHDHGGAVFHAVRLETDMTRLNGKAQGHWDMDGWVGTDTDKLWLKSQGDSRGAQVDHSEIWAMYSRNVDTFWDVQAGVKQDLAPHPDTALGLGVMGLAPYFFETQAHVFVNGDGVLSVRLRQENDVLLTNRLIVKPYAELNARDRAQPAQWTGAGLSDIQAGLQTRYEITRAFAPYVDWHYQQMLGRTAQYGAGHDDRTLSNSVSLGVRWLF